MAEAATEFLLNNLKEEALYHIHLIQNAEVNIKKLEGDLHVFQAFLKDTAKIRKNNERIQQMRREIHNTVYDVEDIIDAFISKKNDGGLMDLIFPSLSKRARHLHKIGKKVEQISCRVEQLRNDIKIPTVQEDKAEIPETRPPRKDNNVVGFVDVTEDLVERLTKSTPSLDVISLTGMFGLGKTTLAWKIFDDPRIRFEFPTRIWVTVSQQFTEKDIFLRILENFTTIDKATSAKNAEVLAREVATCLRGRSFLIVMDDVWNVGDWEKLRTALPMDENKGKVLITSRDEHVGSVASRPRPIVALRPFRNDESWELLRLEALGKLEFPPELEAVGKKIARDCDGLPLAIVVIGGILYESKDSNANARKKNWEKVSEDVNLHLSENDKEKRMNKFISLSYENLPHHLRPCFLYLGLFPEDYDISASKLMRMWTGEGFIQERDARIPLEEIAQNYLKDLINRNLVKTVKLRPDDTVKTCQIHDTLRDFCRSEAATENFLHDIKFNEQGRCVPKVSESCRRLSIHSKFKDYIKKKVSTPRARSFVCFSKEPCDLSGQDSTNIIKAFKFLRVFDVQPLKFKNIDSDLYSLIHMRYIALSITLSMLSPHFDKICNLQTFIINTTSHTLDVKANIWKMKYLKYFKTNASANLPKSTDSANELQTLGLISIESCKGLHERAPNLKKLGIRGELALLFGERGAFDGLRNMEHLRKLKLVNNEAQATVRLTCLPTDNRFPSGLTSLTLCSTFLQWNETSVLGSLKKLEVLKLRDHAFIGNSWKLVGGGSFPCLQFLHIEHTDLALWEASSHHYPKLRGLVLKNCDQLCQIPICLAEIQSFEVLELASCFAAIDAARKILDEKKKTSAEGSGLKLSIFPPPAE